MFGAYSHGRGGVSLSWKSCDFSEECFINFELFNARIWQPQTDGEFCHYTPSPSPRVRNIILFPTQTHHVSPGDDPAGLHQSAPLMFAIDSNMDDVTPKICGISSSRIPSCSQWTSVGEKKTPLVALLSYFAKLLLGVFRFVGGVHISKRNGFTITRISCF